MLPAWHGRLFCYCISDDATPVALAFSPSTSVGSNWPVSCTSHYLVRPLSTWRMTSSFLLTVDGSADQLRSANYRTCVVPRTQNSFGDRDFSVVGPRIWNDLPSELRHADISFGQFRNMLKWYLFRFQSATAHRDILIITP